MKINNIKKKIKKIFRSINMKDIEKFIDWIDKITPYILLIISIGFPILIFLPR